MDAIPEYDARYLAGIAAFNRGDYFEAHEVWEELWKDCPPQERLFIQSLIQAAVALYHWSRTNPAGASRLLAAGREKMQGYRPDHSGLNVDDFWTRVAACLTNDRPRPPMPIIELANRLN